jgi:hypothetical protein
LSFFHEKFFTSISKPKPCALLICVAALAANNRNEEKEHAAMVLEWIKRKGKAFDKKLKDYLFTGKPIAH